MFPYASGMLAALVGEGGGAGEAEVGTDQLVRAARGAPGQRLFVVLAPEKQCGILPQAQAKRKQCTPHEISTADQTVSPSSARG